MPPQKYVETPYPLIDSDPHAGRVIRYMRRSDYFTWFLGTLAPPTALYLWELSEPSERSMSKLRIPFRIAGVIGFFGGFLMAYQRSSFRLWGWTENEREAAKDLAELRQRAEQGLPLYGSSDQPQWVQAAAFRNSVFSQLKFQAFPMFNLVNHQHHGVDTTKYTEKGEPEKH